MRALNISVPMSLQPTTSWRVILSISPMTASIKLLKEMSQDIFRQGEFFEKEKMHGANNLLR
jgi:hypothetical protein